MGSSLSLDSLLEVSPIPCLHLAIGEEINKLSLLLDSPLTMFFNHWITTWVGCLCVGVLAILRAIRCSIGWGLAAAVSLHGMWATSHCHTVMTYSNLTPHFGPFTQKEKNYFCCCLGPHNHSTMCSYQISEIPWFLSWFAPAAPVMISLCLISFW